MLPMARKPTKHMILYMLLAKVITLTIFFASAGYSTPLCIETEKQALMSFKQGLRDPLKKLESWDAARDEDCCRWDGILCDNETGHVAELNLNNGSFTGKISPSLLNLTNLIHLDLGSNDFGGINIPTFIGSLVRLTSLNLTQGGFAGLIPHHLGNLSSLTRLELGDEYDYNAQDFSHVLSNHLKAKSLDWLSGLSSLEYINMNYVNLSEASDHWLLALNKIPSLVELHLSNCELRSINFPPHVNLTSLQVIDLSANSLQSRLPWAIGNLCKLEKLDFSFNYLSGEVSKPFEILTGGCLSKSLMHLSLSGNNMSGSLPVSIEKLIALKSLDISQNRLSGPLPESLGSLSNLETLRLYQNHLSGPLPKSLGSWFRLKEMIVSNNQLNGSLSIGFDSLSNLESLDISSNLLEGEVSEIHFSNLTRLKLLKASDNKMTLKVSPDWIPPFSLHVLELGSWRLGPHFPMWLKTQTNISYLGLSNTGISDAVPGWFWNLSSRHPNIDLSKNQMSGQISYVHGVRGLCLYGNKFNGSLPRISSFIEVLDLSGNFFSGDMSHLLCHPMHETGKLRVLNLKGNLLSGKIPDCWNYWSKMPLHVIDLSNNNLIGEIPSSIGLFHDLKSLHLRNNSFSGEIPKFLQNFPSLTGLDLGLNNFVGNMPRWLGRLQNLHLLGLRSNQLIGTIPDELCALESLQILDIAHNKFSGAIPKCFKQLMAMTSQANNAAFNFGNTYADFNGAKITDTGNLVTKGQELEYGIIISLVAVLDLSSNKLSGDIPEEIMDLEGLKSLNLSRNSFRGHIPIGIGKLMQLESLDLSRNQLSGPIPPSVSSLTFLAYLDLSHNYLSGRIPTGTQLQGFNASNFVGNRLCGPPLTKDCGEGDRNTTGRGVVIDDKTTKDEEDYWFRLGIAVGFGVGFLGIILPLFCSRIWRMAYFWFFQEYLWYKIVDSLNYIKC